MDDWQRLGLEGPTDDVAVVKRAYAKRLKVTRPDDDAAAYQALREAYERVLSRGSMPACSNADDMPSAPPASAQALQAASAEPAPELQAASGPTPEQLCQSLVHAHREHGPAAVRATLPALLLALDALPLAMRDEASVRFADAVIAQPDLPAEVRLALRDHFGWTGDFRVDRLMGTERLLRLLDSLPVVVAPETDPAALEQIAVIAGWRRVLASGRLRATLAAWLLDSALRSQLHFVQMLHHYAHKGTLTMPGHRLLAALPWDEYAGKALDECLATSRALSLAIGVILLGLLLPVEGQALVLQFIFAATIGGAGILVAGATVRGLTWLVRQRARFGPDSVGLPAAIPRVNLYKAHRVGVWVMFLGTFAAWNLFDSPMVSASAALAVLLAAGVVGGWLAQPEDAFETLTIFAVVAFVTVAMDGLSGSTVTAVAGLPFGEVDVRDRPSQLETVRQVGHLVMLCGWFYSGFPSFTSGAFGETWRDLRADQRELRIGAMVAFLITAIPAGVAWAHHRLGHGLTLCAALLAAALALRLQDVGLSPWLSLLALPALLGAVKLLRDAGQAAGRRMLRAD